MTDYSAYHWAKKAEYWAGQAAQGQIQTDWNQADNTKVDYIKNKPTIPTVNNSTITITQGGTIKGSFTLNQSSGDTISLDAGGGSSYTAGTGIDITSDTISVDLTAGTNVSVSGATISTSAAQVIIRRYS